MLLLKFAHIASMFAAATLLMGSIVFLDLVGRRGDVAAYRRLDAIVERTDLVGIGLFIAGIVFGVLTALAGGFDLTAGWLILAYGLVGALFIEGFLFSLPRYARIRKAAQQDDQERAVAEVRSLVSEPRHVLLVAGAMLLWLGVVFVMVVKPNPF